MTTSGSRQTRVRPVSRPAVLVGLLILLATVGGIVWLTESLRHPLPVEGRELPELEDPPADPRIEVVCPEPPPREGQERAEAEPPSLPRVVTSNELYDCPDTWDGQRVLYRGEVVGGVLRRGGGAWVHLNDDAYSDALGPLPAHRDFRGGNGGVGVHIPADLAAEVTWVGGPQSRGDILEVVGLFQRVDPDSAEIAVIRAEGGLVLRPGEPFPDPPLTDRRVAAIIAAAVALGLVVTDRVLRRRR